MNTAYFGDTLTQAVNGTDGIEFAQQEYSGGTFYSGETTQEDAPVWLRIGADEGVLLCFIGIGDGAGAAMDLMMNAMETR